MRNLTVGIFTFLLVPTLCSAGAPLASGPVELRARDGSMRMSFTTRDADAFDVELRPIAGGVEDFVHFEVRPTREVVVYDVDVADAAGLRLVENTLELLDAGGAPRLRVRAPYVIDAHGERRTAHLALPDCAYDDDPTAPWGRAVVAPGAARCALAVSWGDAIGDAISYPATVDPAWVDGGMLVAPRNAHAQVTLDDGRVLVTGGYLSPVSSSYTDAAELFDPATETWAATSSMLRPRAHTTAVLVSSGTQAGKVVVAGGDNNLLPTAEIFDPLTGLWSGTAPMQVPRDLVKTVALADGRVLAAGGCSAYTSTCDTLEASAEVYDPETDVWSPTANDMAEPRAYFTLTPLGDDSVLVAGGCVAFSPGFACFTTTTAADVFDPTTDTFTAAAPMVSGVQNHFAARLVSGEALVAGGNTQGSISLSSQSFDPATGEWTSHGSHATAHNHAAGVTLSDGRVLLTGSWGTPVSSNQISKTADLFDPATGQWSVAPAMSSMHGDHTASLLADGRALVAGGFEGGPNFTLLESGVGEIFDLDAGGGEGGGGAGGEGGTGSPTTTGSGGAGGTPTTLTGGIGGTPAGADSGTAEADGDDGGCGCEVGPGAAARYRAWFFALLAIAGGRLFVRRRALTPRAT